jgi:hypothetical protein
MNMEAANIDETFYLYIRLYAGTNKNAEMWTLNAVRSLNPINLLLYLSIALKLRMKNLTGLIWVKMWSSGQFW